MRFVGALVPGGWREVMTRNRELVLAARKILCQTLEVESPCPDEMIGSLASFPIPDEAGVQPPRSPLYSDPDQDRLRLEHRIEVPIIPWPAPPKRLLRISAQLYNSLPQYERLAQALASILLKR
jgi:isopenicillin-N epimerase